MPCSHLHKTRTHAECAFNSAANPLIFRSSLSLSLSRFHTVFIFCLVDVTQKSVWNRGNPLPYLETYTQNTSCDIFTLTFRSHTTPSVCVFGRHYRHSFVVVSGVVMLPVCNTQQRSIESIVRLGKVQLQGRPMYCRCWYHIYNIWNNFFTLFHSVRSFVRSFFGLCVRFFFHRSLMMPSILT